VEVRRRGGDLAVAFLNLNDILLYAINSVILSIERGRGGVGSGEEYECVQVCVSVCGSEGGVRRGVVLVHEEKKILLKFPCMLRFCNLLIYILFLDAPNKSFRRHEVQFIIEKGTSIMWSDRWCSLLAHK
jgi:hypothetical protein